MCHTAPVRIPSSSTRRLAECLAGCSLLLLSSFGAAPAAEATSGETYFPGRWGDWETRRPEQVGMDSGLLQEAVDFALAHAAEGPRDLDLAIRMGISAQTYDELIGPTKQRGDMSGLVLRHGYIAAEWGDTSRVDMTFSATKSYLATTAGLAWDKRLLRDLHEPVHRSVPTEHFDSPHNSKITWHMLLNQTSEWEGTLWDKPDWAPAWNGQQMRELHEPGTHWQYNDVRVNALALALLHVWRKPLPQILKEHIMDPIGASPTWRWYGYRNSWVNVDGVKMQSVSGGGHWGGGLWISSRDHARFGYLFLRRGKWKGRQLISEAWIEHMTRPTGIKPTYGYMWWLNPDGRRNADVPAGSFSAVGAGTNLVWIDPAHDLVVVVRWIDGAHDQEFLRRVVAAVNNAPATTSAE